MDYPFAHTITTLLLLLLFLTLSPSPITHILAWNSPSLTPPPGNSIQLKTKALDGVHFYRCVDDDWLPDSAFATLVDSSNLSSVVGNYSFVYFPPQPRYVGSWSLLNSDGDAAESGSPVSLVAGKKIVSFSARPRHLPEFLAEASLHKSYGTASFVSYIARLNTNGGMAPIDGYCDDGAITSVPFQADFYLWRQDVVPPSVPQQLQLSSQQRPVECFFGKGFVEYVFNGKEWKQRNILAKIYDLPGGIRQGSYYIKAQADRQGGRDCWSISNPHGFMITGKNACNPVPVESSSLPWALLAVTSSSGNTSLVGPFSYVQMLSTTGGLAPTTFKASVGRVWRSSFTTIFWFYCNI